MQTIWLWQDNARGRRFATLFSLAVALQQRGYDTLACDTKHGPCRLLDPRPKAPHYCWSSFERVEQRRRIARHGAFIRPETGSGVFWPDVAIFAVAVPGETWTEQVATPQDAAAGQGIEIEPGDVAVLFERPDAGDAAIDREMALERAGARPVMVADGHAGEPDFRAAARRGNGPAYNVLDTLRGPTERRCYANEANEVHQITDAILAATN